MLMASTSSMRNGSRCALLGATRSTNTLNPQASDLTQRYRCVGQDVENKLATKYTADVLMSTHS